ncbi:MAG: flagellar assembly protein FliX [Alphaproteobacteria bacterium]|nr:flagellar assembly protein FliX [Alphaproteobacteria bacterium]
MRITNQNRASSVSKKRNTKKTSGASGDFQPVADEDVAEVNVAAPLSPMQPIAAVDSLLAVQEIEQKQQQKKAIGRSHEMLTLLEEIRIGLLSGHIPEQKVHSLTKLADEERQAFEDKGLNNVLDEVNLRAQVELAKMQQR